MAITAATVSQAAKNVRGGNYKEGWEDHQQYLRDRRDLGYVGDGWRLSGVCLMLIGFMLSADMFLLAALPPTKQIPNWEFVGWCILIGSTMMILGALSYMRYLRVYRAAKVVFAAKWNA